MVCKTIKLQLGCFFFQHITFMKLVTVHSFFLMQYERQMRIREIRCELNLRQQVCLKPKHHHKKTTFMSFRIFQGPLPFFCFNSRGSTKSLEIEFILLKKIDWFQLLHLPMSFLFQRVSEYLVALQTFKVQNPANWRGHCWSQ